ncbi:5-oxoprolinase [Bagarius yarrelli]|uniref:5-oxoprolinase n=1 Tax=Bagarius yarrelli TaxID=175774 RepID=A0A556VW68_BAGYA|nr:5-oxoprolinase [Bagarius yarrelli]
MADSDGKFCFAIDRGGTFTDVFARLPDGQERVIKLLSHDPQNYRDAPTEGIRRVLQEETGRSFPRDEPLDSSLIGWIRMGTTVATNALLERQGEKMALAVIEVDERVVLRQDGCRLPNKASRRIVRGESLEVWTKLDLQCLEKDLKAVLAQGITSLAVLLLHSYMYPDHEQAVGSLARQLGFTQVSLSSEVMPMIRAVPRGYTVCVDAYLTPIIHQYDVDVLFMQSDGGLTPVDQFCGSRAVLSGPAGGVVGYALTTYTDTHRTPVIGFDMGGGPLTVTDANLALGRLLPSFFPHIFGPGENEPLSIDETMNHFQKLTTEINHYLSTSQSQGGEESHKSEMSVEEVAMGFIRVANETMCRPIRALTQAKGHDTSQHALACFGGAGGQHACAIARALGMKTVYIHNSQISMEVFLHMRYEGTDCALMINASDATASRSVLQFRGFPYMKEFGFTIADRPITVDDIRVRGSGKSGIRTMTTARTGSQPPKAVQVTKCYFEDQYLDTSVFLWEDLSCDFSIDGPAIIIDKNSTILVEPGCSGRLTPSGDLCIVVVTDGKSILGTELNAVQLSIFSHRFMSIAGERSYSRESVCVCLVLFN